MYLAARTGAEAPKADGAVLIAIGTRRRRGARRHRVRQPEERSTNRCGALAWVTSTPGAAQVNVNALFTVNGVEPTSASPCR